MPSTAFQKALAKTPGAGAAMQAIKDAEKPGFTPPEITDGEYILRVKANCGVSPKEIPFVEFRWTIVEGEFKGKGWSKTYWLSAEDDDERRQKTCTRIGRDLKTLLETEDLLLRKETFYADLNNLVDQVDSKTPFVRSRIQTTKTGDKTYINAYFNRVVNPDVPKVSTVTQSDETTSGAEVLKDMSVIYNGEEYVVLSSNPRNQTCCIRNSASKLVGIEWKQVEVLSV